MLLSSFDTSPHRGVAMAFLARLASLLRNLVQRERTDRQLGAEVESYLDLLASEYEASGLGRDAARRAARLHLGGVEQVKEQVRSVRAGALVDELMQDARYGVRALRTQPRLAAIVVITLALALGGTTAIFGIVDAV